MDLLHKTILDFEPFEQQRLLHFLQSGNNHSSLMELFSIYVSIEKEFKEKELEEKIYAESGLINTSRRIHMLRHRLIGKVSDFLISEQFLERHSSIDKKTLERNRALKSLGVFFILHRRYPNNPFAMRFLKNAIRIAKTNEFLPLLLYALDWQKLTVGHGNEQELIKREKEIDEYELKWKGLRKAVYYFYLLTAIEGKSGKPDMKKISRHNKKAIRELKIYYKKTKLPAIFYYLKYILCDDSQNKGHYKKALEHLYDIEMLMQEHTEVSSTERIGFLNDNLARTYWLMNDFANSLKYIRLAQNNLQKNTMDMALSQEQEFFALIHSGRNTEAMRVADNMLRNLSLKTPKYKHLQDKARFYIVCALFKQEKFKEAQRQIREKLSLVQDKHGWAFSLRLLELYLLIELNVKEEIKSCLERLNKFLAYHRFTLSKRNKLILQTISLLKRCDFIPDVITNKSIKRNVKLLRSNKENFRWNSQGDEVIRFDYWIERKFLK